MLLKDWESHGVQVSARTVRRRLVESGLRARRPRKKPKLTPAMIKKRYEWARHHKNFTKDDWSKVCFSDESIFHIIDDRTSYVRRHPGEAFHPDCILERVKHSTSVMVWSVMSVYGPGRLHIVEGNMNQVQYKKVLEPPGCCLSYDHGFHPESAFSCRMGLLATLRKQSSIFYQPTMSLFCHGQATRLT